MNPDPKSYILSDAESRAIFEKKIVPVELGVTAGGGAASDTEGTPTNTRQPLAVFVIGQTGAGKTRTAPALLAAMRAVRGDGDGNGVLPPAHFIADTYKAYHPAWADLAASRPGLASPATGPDARRWLAMAAARAAELRRDVLLESACRHAGDFADLARILRAARYRIEVAVLATPSALSLLGVLARFYLHGLAAEESPGPGPANLLPARLTPRAVHDESYTGVLEAAALIDGLDLAAETKEVVDQVVVVRRDNLVAYADERDPDGRWMHSGSGSGGVVAALEAERRRPPTSAERAAADTDLQMLRDLGIPGLDAQLREIEALLDGEPAVPEANNEIRPPEFPPLGPWKLPGPGADSTVGEKLSLRLGT